MNFKHFLNETDASFPDLLLWIRSFFANRFDLKTLWIYADWLEERGRTEESQFFRQISKWQDLKRKKGAWKGSLVHQFYRLFGQRSHDLSITDTGSSWLIQSSSLSQTARHIIYPGQTSYALSLTNGKWSVYKNRGHERVGVVSTRHRATPDSERYHPNRRVSLNNYKSIDINQVPDDVLHYAFYRIIEKQVRGS